VSIVTARTLIAQRMTGFTALPVYYPADGDKRPVRAGKGWAEVNVQTSREAASQQETGADSVIFRHPGLVIVSVFTPARYGEVDGLTHAEEIAVLFRRKKDSQGTTDVLYRAPNVRSVGLAGEYYQTDCEIPFRADVIYTIQP